MPFDRDLARAIRDLDEYELRRLLIFAQDLLEATDGPRFEIQARPGQKMSLRRQAVKCGKNGCKKCPHGPYWYGYWREGGRTRSRYFGRELPKGLLPATGSPRTPDSPGE